MTSIDEELPPAAQLLHRLGIPFRVHWHPEARRHAELERTGLDVGTSAKTLAFTVPGEALVLAAIPGLGKLRYGNLARAIGVSRSTLTPAGPEALAVVSSEPGGVAPITDLAEVRVVLDASLLALPVVYCGSGLATASLELAGADLARASATVIIADLVGEAE